MRDTTDEDLDDRELELALKEGERAPAWLVGGGDVPPEEATEATLAAMQELRREIDPAARDRIVEHVVETYLRGAPTAPTHGRVVQLGPPRRRWLWALPALAAAAAAVLLLWPGAPWTDAGADRLALAGKTRLRPATRGDVSPGALHLAQGSDLYLECEPGVDDFTVVAVQATRGAEVQGLGFKQTAADRTTAELYVRADLTPGRWDVQCGVRTGAGRFAWVDPPEPLIID